MTRIGLSNLHWKVADLDKGVAPQFNALEANIFKSGK